MSDLHLEFGELPPTFNWEPVDLVILAGDIDLGVRGIRWAKEIFKGQPVVYVMGNHEFYDGDLELTLAEAREESAGSNVHLLECDVLDLPKVRILGCTLWSDFRLLGAEREEDCKVTASKWIRDYRAIAFNGKAATPEDTQRLSNASYQWLDQKLNDAQKPTIVVTHHCPSLVMRNPYFNTDQITAVFNSAYDNLLRAPVKAWVTGHTHHNHDFMHSGIRLISHQKGYPREYLDGFNWHQVFDVEV